jgi:hypothetical protein
MGTRSTHIPADELLAIVAAARRAGRYDPAARRLCDRCLEWVDEIVHVTIDRKRICPACCAALPIPIQDIPRSSTAAGQGGSHVNQQTREHQTRVA